MTWQAIWYYGLIAGNIGVAMCSAFSWWRAHRAFKRALEFDRLLTALCVDAFQ